MVDGGDAHAAAVSRGSTTAPACVRFEPACGSVSVARGVLARVIFGGVSTARKWDGSGMTDRLRCNLGDGLRVNVVFRSIDGLHTQQFGHRVYSDPWEECAVRR